MINIYGVEYTFNYFICINLIHVIILKYLTFIIGTFFFSVCKGLCSSCSEIYTELFSRLGISWPNCAKVLKKCFVISRITDMGFHYRNNSQHYMKNT